MGVKEEEHILGNRVGYDLKVNDVERGLADFCVGRGLRRSVRGVVSCVRMMRRCKLL